MSFSRNSPTRSSPTHAVVAQLTTVPLLIIDDLGMRKLPHTAAEDLLEIVMRRYERASTLNRPVEDWGKLLGDTAAVTAMLDRLLHHAHLLTCGPRSWRIRLQGERSAPCPRSPLHRSGNLRYNHSAWALLLAGFAPSLYGRFRGVP